MVAASRLICDAREIEEGGRGVRFVVERNGNPSQPAFAVRFEGVVYAYLNRCAHIPVELDWAPGEFFDVSKLYLICSTHGAMYLPDTGRCVAGPCKGCNLVRVPVQEVDGKVYLID